ncbi:MAG: TolC family protein [Acidobacteriota bacterium]
MRRHFLWISTACLLLAAAVQAGEGLPVLTLDEALSQALERNRDIQKAQAYREWVRGKYLEERSAALPRLSLSASKRRDFDDSLSALTGGLFPSTEDTTSYGATVDQAVFTWGQVGAAIRAAKVGLASADEQLRLYRQAVQRDVTQAFYDVLLAKELLAVAQEEVDQRTAHLGEARKRFELGTATDYDVLAAEVALQNARPALIAAENTLRRSRLALGLLLGLEEGVDAAGALQAAPIPLPSFSEALETARRLRPEVRAQEQVVAVRRELLAIARAGDKPRLDFSAGWGRKTLGVSGLHLSGRTWNAGLTLSFPLFDGLRTRGRVLEASSDLLQAQLEERKLRESLAVEVQGALDAVWEAEAVLRALEGAEAQAQRLLDMAEKGFAFGVKTQLEVDDALVQRNAARAHAARARRDLAVAQTNLRWVLGTLGEDRTP